MSDIVRQLLDAPFGHLIDRDGEGNSRVTLFRQDGTALPTVTAPTFDEAVARALALAYEDEDERTWQDLFERYASEIAAEAQRALDEFHTRGRYAQSR